MIQTRQGRAPTRSNLSDGRWLHLCNGLDPVRDGGMVPSILGMTEALARSGENITIVTPTASRIEAADLDHRLVLKGPETRIEDAVRNADVVHIHGLWQAHGRRGALGARKRRVPYLIAAHGMAEPWALRHKRWKKYLYLTLLERRNLRQASCLHALSHAEIQHLRRLAPWTPVAFIPNGVDLACFDDLPERGTIEAAHPELRDKFVLLFFGRLHAKKGLDLLAKALRDMAGDYPDLHVLLAGTDDGAWAPFQEEMRASNLGGRVTYVGYVSGERAREVWSRADAFVLPSYSEGFSMAILEALGCRLPSLITTSCHFPELSEAEGAITAEPHEEGIERGLRRLLEMTPQERARMGLNGRRLVESRYTWSQQAKRLASVYRWLLGEESRPDCVEM